MVKEIEIYNGKKIKVDFNKVTEYICACFSIFLFIIYILFPDKEMGPGVVSVKNNILIVVTAFTFITLLATYVLKREFKIDKYIIVLGIYLGLIIVSAFNSKYINNTWFGIDGRYEGVVTLVCYFVCFYLFYKGFKYNEKIFELMTIAVILNAGYGVIQAIFGDIQYARSDLPNTGWSIFTNPNMFSSFLTLFMPIYLVKYFLDKKDKDYYIYVCGIVFAGLVCTKTFGGYLTFAIYFTVLSIYFICISKDKKEILQKVLKILIVFLVIFMVLNASNNFVYFDEIGINALSVKEVATGEKDINTLGTNRMFIWKLCLDIVGKNPVFGVGPDSLGREVYNNYFYKDDYLWDTILVDKAHNEYLHVAVTTGIPSVLVYVCFLVMIVTSLILKYKKYVKNGEILENKTMMLVAVSASIGSYLIQAFANISIFAVAPLFWAMLGVGAKISEKEY